MGILHMFALLFAVGNPIDDLPFFISLTRGKKFSDVHLTIIIACLASFIISVAFLYFGEQILDSFDIGIEAFRITGGLVIGLLGFKLLFLDDEEDKEKAQKEEAKQEASRDGLISKAIVPLAIPLLAGPATVSAIVLLTTHSETPDTRILITVGILAVADYIIFLLAGKLAKFLGKVGILVISKIMGLIMIAMGVQYVIYGLTNSFPGWV